MPPKTHLFIDGDGDEFEVNADNAALIAIDFEPPPPPSPPSSDLTIPETIPYVVPAGFTLPETESFQAMMSCVDTPEVTCDPTVGTFAQLVYMGHGLEYLYDHAEPGQHDHAWWTPGDREGYGCFYAFMYDNHPNPFGALPQPRDAQFIARATIVRPQGAGYGKVNDRYMAEGQRYYVGSRFEGTTAEIPDENARQLALDDFDYAAYTPRGPGDRIRVGLWADFGNGPEIGDIRDFTPEHLDHDSPPRTFWNQNAGWFEFVSVEDTDIPIAWASGSGQDFDDPKITIPGTRATIVFVMAQTNAVSHVLYYDTLNTGRLSVEVNGVLQ